MALVHSLRKGHACLADLDEALLAMMRLIVVTQVGISGHLAWLTGLLVEGSVFRRVGSQDWYCSLGHLEGLTAIAWPVVLSGSASKQSMVFQKVTVSDLEWIVVLDLEAFQCLPVEPVSPLNAHVSRFPNAGQGLTIKVTGKPMSLVKYAASRCFHKLPLVFLNQLAKHLGVEVETPSLFGTLGSLVRHCLPHKTESEYHDILAMRLINDTLFNNELLQQEGVEDCFNDGDTTVFKEYLASADNEKDTSTKYHEEFQAHVMNNRKGGVKKIPIKWPATGVDMHFAKTLLPPSASSSLQKDTFNNRWLCFVRLGDSRISISRSWPLYGERRSLLLCAKQAWTIHTRARPQEQCPFSEVMECE